MAAAQNARPQLASRLGCSSRTTRLARARPLLEASDPADLVPDRSQSFLGALEFNATVSVPMYAKYFFALQDCLGKPSQRRMSAPSSAILAVTEQLKGNKAGHESAVCPQTSF